MGQIKISSLTKGVEVVREDGSGKIFAKDTMEANWDVTQTIVTLRNRFNGDVLLKANYNNITLGTDESDHGVYDNAQDLCEDLDAILNK